MLELAKSQNSSEAGSFDAFTKYLQVFDTDVMFHSFQVFFGSLSKVFIGTLQLRTVLYKKKKTYSRTSISGQVSAILIQ